MPVRARIVLFFGLIMAIVLGTASVFVLSRLRSELGVAIDTGLRARAATLLGEVKEDFEDVGHGLIDEEEIVAQILSSEGRVLESTTSLGPGPLVPPGELPRSDRPAALDTTARVGGDRERVRLLATRSPTGVIVVVGASTEDAREALAALSRLLAVSGPVVLLLAAGAVWLLAGVALRPVERLRTEAEALSLGTDRRRLPVPATRDEIARLAKTLNTMLERLEDALERERRFVDDASHELRTPLAVLKAELELATSRARSREELEATVRSAASEVDELARLAEQLLLLARADRGLLATARTPTDIGQLVEQLCAGFRDRAQQLGIGLSIRTQPLSVDVDPLLLRQAVSNLIDNAMGHTPPGGGIEIVVTPSPSGAEIGVSDTGPGFDPELLPRAFEPFARADGARRRGSGTGLGLSIVRAIVDAHGGRAEARNRPQGGASVVLLLPA